MVSYGLASFTRLGHAKSAPGFNHLASSIGLAAVLPVLVVSFKTPKLSLTIYLKKSACLQ